MNLNNLMRMGSLTMNLLQSDHFKELMGLMGNIGNMGNMGNMNSPSRLPWFMNRQGQGQTDDKTHQPGLKQPGGQENNFQFEHPWFPFQNMFGNQQKRSFPFSANSLPPWMMQRPRTGMWKSINPTQSNTPFDPFSMGGYTTTTASTQKSRQNRIFIQDMQAKKKHRKRNVHKTMAKKR